METIAESPQILWDGLATGYPLWPIWDGPTIFFNLYIYIYIYIYIIIGDICRIIIVANMTFR
jgi:hypothetical protein